MFDELAEGFSRLFSWRWPSCEGRIVAVDVQKGSGSRYGGGLVLAIGYEFPATNKNYSCEYFWEPASPALALAAKEQLKIGQSVTVRYRLDDPNVNTLDRRIFDDLEDDR